MLIAVPTPVRRRPHWLVTASCFVLAIGATLAATWHEPGASVPVAKAGTGTSASAVARASASASPSGTAASPGTRLSFGLDFSDTLGFESPQALGESLDDAVRMGAQYIRVDFAWEDYQSTSAAFAPDFSRFDQVVDAANSHHLQILATIGFPPIWARESSCHGSAACPPASDTQFAEFAAKAAAHFAPLGVHDWEIWNEPNIPSWDPKPNPAAYAKLLSSTAKALHDTDDKAYVIMGGLAAEQPHPGIPYIAAADFITAVAKDGGLAGVQAVAYHPYPGQSNVAVSPSIEAIDSAPDNIVEALSKAGRPTMPIWITETGASVPAARQAHPTADAVATQQAAQAATAANLVATLSHTANVAAMFWFNDKDQPAAGLVYGLRTSSGVVRPALAALRKAIYANRGK
jgi:hypothetical protein